jgi:hypothetical protein
MSNLEELFELLQSRKDKIEFYGPKNETLVASLEKALSVDFPPSYRQFLLNFGGAFFYGNAISGIWNNNPLLPNEGSTFGDTICYKKDYGMPGYLIVIQPDEDAPHYLDTKEKDENGEMPVVCYELHSGHIEVIAKSFREYLIDWVLPMLDGDAV